MNTFNISRRSFMAGILAAGAAPALVRAESLMQIVLPCREIVLPDRELVVVGEEWLDLIKEGWRPAGSTPLDIHYGNAQRISHGGVVYMGCRFERGSVSSLDKRLGQTGPAGWRA